MNQESNNNPLATPIQFLRGVGPRRAEVFEKLGVTTAEDLLGYFPRGHEFRPPLCLIDDMEKDHHVTVTGQVQSMRYVARSRPPRMTVQLEDATGHCQLVWFYGNYMKDKLSPGDVMAAWGKVSKYKETVQLVNPKWKKIDDMEEFIASENMGSGIYPACSELSSAEIQRVIRQGLDGMLEGVTEWFDEAYNKKRKMPSLRKALEWIHRPASEEQAGEARRKLAYDELFLMELAIGLRREQLQRAEAAYPLEIEEEINRRIRKLFPFMLTYDQDVVIEEIVKDMARTVPMNRLVQGDVGSGKTVIAVYAALLTVAKHKQVAIMAPTEILAEQHYEGICRYLENSKVRRVLLKGGLTGKRRREVLDQIAEGEYDIVVGTQALLQKDVQFKELALVVIDEQHKFGVRQRELIRGKTVAPHTLVMTATPIPRTLAMTVFGDLDVSVIEHLPPGRQAIKTSWHGEDKLSQAYEFIRKHVRAGEQVYFVYPRVEAEKIEDDLFTEETAELLDEEAVQGKQIKAAIDEHRYLQETVFPELKVGLLHGQMGADEKKLVMEKFRQREIQILVSTVVIEVGVDVPNATIMVIEHAERFGLAQLHQLRGRIGRGEKQSYCLLFGQPNTEQGQQRLEIMTKSQDGFKIAEEDLKIRGPGEFFGTDQHGLPELKIADLLSDFDLLRMARRDAFEIAKKDPDLSQVEHAELRVALGKKFGENIRLIDIG